MSQFASFLECIFPELQSKARSCLEGHDCLEKDRKKNDQETDSYYDEDDSEFSDSSYGDDDLSTSYASESEPDYDSGNAEKAALTGSTANLASSFDDAFVNSDVQRAALQKMSKSNLFAGAVGNDGSRAKAFQNIMMRREMDETMGAATQNMIVQSAPRETVATAPKPSVALNKIWEEQGFTNTATRSFKSIRETGYFHEHTDEQIAGYDMALMSAVRSQNLATLREMHDAGRDLQVCNPFHESILHTVARVGNVDMLNYLMNEANVNLRVCCDSGRTPLHDACWTTTPNFALITIILTHSPDFLLVGDNRNFTPLDYIPKQCYEEWNSFLRRLDPALLQPKVFV